MVSARVAEGLEALFGSNIDSDCTILFCREDHTARRSVSCPSLGFTSTERNSPGGRAASLAAPDVLGQPLPAHKLVLRLASERFAAQLDRWRNETGDIGLGNDSLAATGWPAAASCSPVLRVPLSSEEEVPAARAAIAFAYTGEVQAGSIREALEIRRQGAYLQIEGCTAACDLYVRKAICVSTDPLSSRHCVTGAGGKLRGVRNGNSNGDSVLQDGTSRQRDRCSSSSSGVNRGGSRGVSSDGSNSNSTTSAPAPAVLELYACETLWPGPHEDHRFEVLILYEARRQLVAHFRDALHTLNTPSLRRQMLALSAVGLEALLEPDHFGTDSESTVLLLLATWMETNYHRTDAATRQRLCRHVRLVQLSKPYLGAILPALALDHETKPDLQAGWFALGVMEAAFIQEYTDSPSAKQSLLEMAAATSTYDLTAPTYSATPRPHCVQLGAPIILPWHITASDLVRTMQGLEAGQTRSTLATFDSADPRVCALGFEWRPALQVTHGATAAGVFLMCELPQALAVPGGRLSGGPKLPVVASLQARLTVHRWQNNVREEACSVLYELDDYMSTGSGCGRPEDLPLRAPVGPVATAGSVAVSWGRYLREGRVTGTLSLLRMSFAY